MAIHNMLHGADTIAYEIVYSRRKTLGITVHADRRVTVRAPRGTGAAEIAGLVREKAGWIVEKRRMFADLPPPPPPPRYVSGESHLYLGRPYRLQINEGRRQGAALDGDTLRLCSRDPGSAEHNEALLREWYRGRAREVFSARLDACCPRAAALGIARPPLKIRLMKRRWGSCSSKGSILLNLRLIQTPVPCIDYVLFHELAHMKELNHGRAFYALLAQMLPDWRARRQALNAIKVF